MATIVAGSSFPLNMLAPGSFYVTGPSNVISYSSSLIVLRAPDGDAQYYEGVFTYTNVPGVGIELSGGTLTGFLDYTAGGFLRGSIKNFAVDAATYAAFSDRNDAAGLENYILNQAPATVSGSNFADILVGGQFSDTFTGGGGNDAIDGRGGSNTAVYSGFRSSYQISAANGLVTVADTRGIDGTDTLVNIQSLRFLDGTVSIVPVVTASSPIVGRGGSVSAASLVSVNDALPIVKYQFWDDTADPASGHFVLNGAAQPALTSIDVTPAQLAGLSFQSGSGADTLYVKVTDGASTSGWIRFGVTAPVDAAPIIASFGASGRAQAIAAASLFGTTDADGDAITQYELWDPVAGNGGFTIGGAAPAARQVLDVSSLAGLAWDTTGQSGATVFSVRAFDGVRWSDWTSVSVDSGETPPTITSLGAGAHRGSQLGGAALFRTDDREGDAITQYELWDPVAGNGGFTVNGVSQVARQDLLVADLNTVAWDTTGQSGAAVFAVRAFDGLEWSDWTTVAVNATDAAPRVTNLAGSAHGAQQVAASTLFQASDPDADAITQYELWDPAAGNGQLVLNGQAQVARQVITVDAADFAALDWDSTGQSGPAILAVRASDGTLWSDWTTVTVGSRNAAPTVAALDPTVDIGQAVAPASLFQATDPDGDAIAKYEFWDPAAGNGGFTLNGTAQAARQVLSVSSLAGLAWDTTGQDGTAVFAMRASDGSAWSDWTTVSVDAIPPAAGVVINIAIDPIGPIPPLTPLPAGTTPYDPSQLVTALATSAADQNGTVTTPLAPATEPLPTLAASHG